MASALTGSSVGRSQRSEGPRGTERIAAAFARAAGERRAALMPYLMGGYPTLTQSTRIGEACVQPARTSSSSACPTRTRSPMGP